MKQNPQHKSLSLEEIREIWLDSPVLRLPRDLKHRDDWGHDQETAGVHLMTVKTERKEEDYARYLGKHPIGYVVGIKQWDGTIFKGEVYETLEELKMKWQID